MDKQKRIQTSYRKPSKKRGIDLNVRVFRRPVSIN